jgi:hypothetical protein
VREQGREGWGDPGSGRIGERGREGTRERGNAGSEVDNIPDREEGGEEGELGVQVRGRAREELVKNF